MPPLPSSALLILAVLLAPLGAAGQAPESPPPSGAGAAATATEPGTEPETATEPGTATEPATETETATATETSTSATETEPLVLDVAVEPTPAPEVRRELASPRVDRAREERSRRNIEFAAQGLAHERGSADLELAVAVNLYVGGVLLSLLSASLVIGTIFEAACINGDISECTDGPAFLIGAIPATIGAAALLFGAATTDQRVQAHYRSLDRRGREIEDRRRALAPSASLSFGPTSLTLSGRF